MTVHIYISNKYVLSSEEEEVLKRAAKILDNLYLYSQDEGKLEKDFQEARNGLDYLLDKLEFDGEYSYWREEATEDATTGQG